MKRFVYVSSWTHGEPDAGICLYEMDTESGAMSFIERYEDRTSFNVTVVDKDNNILYAVNETNELPGMHGCGGGQVFTFSIDRESGRLTKLDSRPTWCPNPSYMAVDPSGKFAVVSNHGGNGAVSKLVKDMYGKYVPQLEFDDVCVELFEIKEDRILGDLLDVVKHYPSEKNPRSKVGHPHCTVFSPDGKMFAVCDKGNDTVRMYKIDPDNKRLFVTGAVQNCVADSKPRYCVFSPDGKHFYHNNEGTLDFCSYEYDEDGSLKLIGRTDLTPDNYVKKPRVREEQQGICISPDGSVIYDIVRGPNTVAVLKIDPADGTVTKIQDMDIPDMWPRGCNITPDGQFLAVCGLDGGKVFLFRIGQDGKLSDTGLSVEQNKAAYVSFL